MSEKRDLETAETEAWKFYQEAVRDYIKTPETTERQAAAARVDQARLVWKNLFREAVVALVGQGAPQGNLTNQEKGQADVFVYAKWFNGWSVSLASLSGRLPKFDFGCGRCGGITTARPRWLPNGAVGTHCHRCGELNIFRSLSVEVGL